MLERNLTRHMEAEFDHLALLPYFITKQSSTVKHTPELKHVPDFFNWRELPNFPKKPRQLPQDAKVARLRKIAELLQACKKQPQQS